MRNPTGHPARYSIEIIDHFKTLLSEGERVHDPYAGTGEQLGRLADEIGLRFTGTEIEPLYIVDRRVKVGDSTRRKSYPRTAGWTLVTSPVYPNGNCLAQEHRVLTRDLRWVPVGDLLEGDELLGFEDEPRNIKAGGNRARRRYEWSTVMSSSPAKVECVRVVLDDGTEVITTPDHPWLAQPYVYGDKYGRAGWVESRHLMGSPITGGPTRTGYRQSYFVRRQFGLWHPRRDYDAGWLAGMFDGEGHLVAGGAKTAPKLGMSQKPGALMDRAERIVTDAGFYSKRYGGGGADQLLLSGAWGSIAEFLGTFRPDRLLQKWSDLPIDQYSIQPTPVQVVAVESVGRREIQRLTTSTGTYIGEGFLMHNSDYFASSPDEAKPWKRNTYRHSIVRLSEGQQTDLAATNMARFGYRGTMHDGTSKRRREFWDLARKCVGHWTPAERCIVNVSDFYSGFEEVEPFVDDWIEMMVAFGWEVGEREKIATPRYRNGSDESRDQRVDFEDVIVFVQSRSFA